MSRRKPKPYLQEDPFIEWLAWLMDESIPLGPWRVGLDGFIGLIPGVGDMAGAVVSTLIIARAMRSGIPKSAVFRMVINVGLDSLLGAVPFLGDLFDFAFKSNTYNLQIYREALRGERRPLRDWSFAVFIFLLLFLILALPIVGFIYLVKFLAPHISL
jgi:hypothetical protein